MKTKYNKHKKYGKYSVSHEKTKRHKRRKNKSKTTRKSLKRKRNHTVKRLRIGGRTNLSENTRLNEASYRRNQQHVEQIENDDNMIEDFPDDSTIDTFMSTDDDISESPFPFTGDDAYGSLISLRDPHVYIEHPNLILHSYIEHLYFTDFMRRIYEQDKLDYFLADIAEVLTFIEDVRMLSVLKCILIEHEFEGDRLPESVQNLLVPYRGRLNTHITNLENRLEGNSTTDVPPFALLDETT